MALHSRKFLLENFSDLDEDETPVRPCSYLCYQCPIYCFFPQPPPPPSPSHEAHRTPTVLIVMLCVLGIVLLLISYLTVARYRNLRRRSVAIREDGNQGGVEHHVWYIRSEGFSESLIDSIAAFEFKSEDGLIDGQDCAVCLNEYREGERLRLLLKCSHAFHVTCIDTWLRAHQSCPVCRAPIIIGNSMPVNHDGSDILETSEIEEGSRNNSLDDEGMKRLQPVRRSMSMDFLNTRHARGLVLMKRSFSFSGKRIITTQSIDRSCPS